MLKIIKNNFYIFVLFILFFVPVTESHVNTAFSFFQRELSLTNQEENIVNRNRDMIVIYPIGEKNQLTIMKVKHEDCFSVLWGIIAFFIFFASGFS
ncbi:hypothetical protein [Bartonella tribocorum]|uniref:Uncharacterized protein n=1 Tax=Bartonella tribocorum TaxID=85701 RepID=A0A2M6USV8_9HYPH|nr:hypothetical protein [Bartonella tribocorum]PIT69272.1 hypothetical protein CEV08_06455 [Bartonella tribocorum]